MNFFPTPGAASLNSVERELQSNVHNQEEPQTHTTPNTTRLPLSPTEPLTSSDSLLHFYQRGHPSYSTTTRRFFGYIFLLFFLTWMITSIILGVLYIRKDWMLHQLSQQQLLLQQQQQQQQQKVTPQRPFLTLLQSNDLYEIQSMGGKGGFSRLSALYKALPGLHKIHVFAGDLISLSPMSLIKINGKPLRGEHMIDIGNDVFDIAALGNHEFDYDAETTMKRLSESTFPWIRTNVLPENGIFAELDKMGKTKAYEIRTYSIPREILGEEMKLLRVAFIGLSPVYQPVKFVKIQSIAETLAALPSLLAKIRTQYAPHLVVAITHWNLKDDIQLAAADLGIDLILGGHEHENIITFRPPRNTPITKADSDAESVYIHTVHLYQSDVTNEAILSEFPSNTPSIVRRADLVLAVTRRLQEVTEDLPTDPTVDLKVEKWWQIGRQGFLDAGYDVDEEIYTLDNQWDLRRDWISTYMATKEGTLFSECLMWCGQTYMAHAANKPRMSLLSSGQIRIDAVMFPRTLTTYDVFRMVPYFTNLITASIRGGSLLNAIRTSLSENVGEGGFLLWSSNFTCDTGNANTDLQCVLDGQPIQEDEMYEIYTNNFLLSGNERNMEGLRADGNNILVTGTAGADGQGIPLQRCIVDYLKRGNLENQKKTKKRTEQRKELNGRHHG